MQDFLQENSKRDKKVESLVGMGFAEDMAKMAVTECGMLSIEVTTTFPLVAKAW